MNEKTLLITGWTHWHAAGTSIAVEKIPEADITVLSKRRLAEHLLELASHSDYGTIYIIGLAIGHAPALLAKALKRLSKKGISVIWISAAIIPYNVNEETQALFSEMYVRHQACFAGTVADYFNIRKNSATLARAKRILKNDQKSDSERKYHHLLAAASYRYRLFQEDAPFSTAIRTIALGKQFTEDQKLMIKDFLTFGHRELKGNSPWLHSAREVTKRVGEEGNCRVLITGETGTGKETIATLIHQHSPRRDELFIPFNCADLSPQLIESRLFGHKKGAFTGAESARRGAFELADGGTLFLDEVGELSQQAQAGLLRVLQEARFFKLGAERETQVDVRVVAATNRNLYQMVKEGSFREDLFYRLNTIAIHVPPLRERPEDLEVIADNYLIHKGYSRLSSQQKNQLKAYHWPGNVRELENLLDRANILGIRNYEDVIKLHKAMFKPQSSSTQPETLDEAKRLHIAKILDKYNGHKTQAAKALGITINTLKANL